jgi:hypothetical protein
MKKLAVSFVLTLAVFSISYAQGVRPSEPDILKQRIGNYSVVSYDMQRLAYKAAVDAGHLDTAKLIRDEVLYGMLSDFDVRYGKFKTDLTNERGKQNVILDIADNAFVAAIGFGAPAKAFAAVSQLFRNSRQSYDKNFFKGQTLTIIIAAMDTNRLNQLTSIQNNLLHGVDAYPLDAGILDAVRYWNYGTIDSALQNLSEVAGTSLQAARSNSLQSQQIRSNMIEQRNLNLQVKPKQEQ